MDSQKQPAKRTTALTREDKLEKYYNEMLSTEKTFVDAMPVFVKELTRLRDTGFEIEFKAEALKGKKGTAVRVSPEDHAFLTDLIKMIEGFIPSPLLDPPINQGDFKRNFKELMDRGLSQDNKFNDYMNKMAEYTRQYDYINKTLTDLSKKYINNRYKNPADMKRRSKEENELIDLEIGNKLLALSSEWVKPVQRSPRYGLLFRDMSNNLTQELYNSENDKLNNIQNNITKRLTTLNTQMALSDAPTYFTQSNMLKSLAELIRQKQIPSQKTSIPRIQKEFERISRFSGIVVSKEGLTNKFNKIDKQNALNDALYQILSPEEKILYKAFTKLAELNMNKAKNKDEIAKQETLITDLISLIQLEHKKNYVTQAKELTLEMKKEVESLAKQRVLSQSDLENNYKYRLSQIEKSYMTQQKEIRDERVKIDSRLGKSTFVAKAKEEIKREIKKERRESVPAPLGKISLPPDTPQPGLPRGVTLPPNKLPPPLPRVEKPERSLADELAAVPPPTDTPPPPAPTDIPPPPAPTDMPPPPPRFSSGAAFTAPPSDDPLPPPSSNKAAPAEEVIPPPKYIPMPPSQAEIKKKPMSPEKAAHLSTTASIFGSINGKPVKQETQQKRPSWINRLSTRLSTQPPQKPLVETKTKEATKPTDDEKAKDDSTTPRKR